MKRICITRGRGIDRYHYKDDTFESKGSIYHSTNNKFVPIVHHDKLIIIHHLCLKSVESKHEGCRYLLDSSNFYCCLAPQTKINKIVYLDDETEKRINLQFLNEPYCISRDNDYYYDDNEIYMNVTNKCGDLDSV